MSAFKGLLNSYSINQREFFLQIFFGFTMIISSSVATSAPQKKFFLLNWATSTLKRNFPLIFLHSIWSIATFLLVRNAKTFWLTSIYLFTSLTFEKAIWVYYRESKGQERVSLQMSRHTIYGAKDACCCISGKDMPRAIRSYISKSGQSILRLLTLRLLLTKSSSFFWFCSSIMIKFELYR